MEATLLDQMKAQAQVLVPVIKELRAELGEEKANALMRKALGNWAQGIGKKINQKIPGNPTEKMATLSPVYAAGGALDFKVLKQTEDTFEYNVTGCRYAQFYKDLGEPELGFLFVCSQDFPIAEGISPDLELTRTQTIMQGANYCDFRYKLKNKEE